MSFNRSLLIAGLLCATAALDAGKRTRTEASEVHPPVAKPAIATQELPVMTDDEAAKRLLRARNRLSEDRDLLRNPSRTFKDISYACDLTIIAIMSIEEIPLALRPLYFNNLIEELTYAKSLLKR